MKIYHLGKLIKKNMNLQMNQKIRKGRIPDKTLHLKKSLELLLVGTEALNDFKGHKFPMKVIDEGKEEKYYEDSEKAMILQTS